MLELLSRTTLHTSLLPADQRYPTCFPWALALCCWLSLSAGCPKEVDSVLLMLRTPPCRPSGWLIAGWLLGGWEGKLPVSGTQTSVCGIPGDQVRAEGLFRESKGAFLEERRGPDLCLDLPVTL